MANLAQRPPPPERRLIGDFGVTASVIAGNQMSNSDHPDPSSQSPRRQAPVPKDACPIALSADLIGDRWSMLILREAFYGVVRFDDMLADLGAPRSTLTERLAKLVEHGLLVRKPYREPGSRTRHAYVLTDAGQALGLTFIALSQWGEAHILKKAAPVRFVEKGFKRPVRATLIDGEGRSVLPKNVTIHIKAR